MKTNIMTIAMSSLCLIGFTHSALADHHHRHHESSSSLSISLGTPVPPPTTVVTQTVYVKEPRHHRGLQWVDAAEGAPLPTGMVEAGNQSHPNMPLFVCRANYRGGVHPGSLIGSRCSIGWGGNEVSLPRYQVLVSRRPLNWVSASNGFVPPNAVFGGYQRDQQLAVCQAQYHNGMHPGKVVGSMCNFAYHGREISIPYYNVLVNF